MSSTDETAPAGTEGCSTIGFPIVPEGEEAPPGGSPAEHPAAERPVAEHPAAEHPSGEVASISFSFGRIDESACTLYPSTLTLYSNGAAEFHATGVASDNSGDVWLIRGMALLDRNGVELYRIPQFNSPQLDLEDHNYPWDVTGLYFPPYLYPYITKARMYHHC